MAIDPPHQSGRSDGRSGGHSSGRFPATRRAPRLWPAALVVVGVVGLLATAEIAASVAAPTSGGTMTRTAAAVVVFLVALTIGAGTSVTAAQSRWSYVFCARRTAICGLGLLAVAGVLIAALVRSGPLRHAFSSFQIGAVDVAGIGLLYAVGVCLLTAGVALFDASDARRNERSWPDSIPRT